MTYCTKHTRNALIANLRAYSVPVLALIDTMSTTQSNPYEPTQRLIDNPSRLRELYITRDLGYRTIADEYAQCSKSTVRRAIQEYGIDEEYEQVQREKKSRRGLSPPQPQPKDLEWSDMV